MAEKDRNIRIRNEEIRVKVTSDELNYAKEKAKCCHLNLSEFVRKAIMDSVIIKYDPFDIKELSKELNKIGININQIAKHINEKGGAYERQDIENLILEFQEIQEIVYSKVLGIK